MFIRQYNLYIVVLYMGVRLQEYPFGHG